MQSVGMGGRGILFKPLLIAPAGSCAIKYSFRYLSCKLYELSTVYD